MKRIIVVFLVVVFAALLLPLAVVYLVGHAPAAPEPETERADSETVSVYLPDEERTEEMSVSDYLCGVVAAEMPADFELEALKAQAVAARTYLYSRLEQEKAEEHHGADICADYTHCQAYISESDRRESWGSDADANWEKIERAVNETTGQIMTYNGETISALFHSTSSGATEAAADVWGNDVPYLKSVKSEGDVNSPKYLSSVTLTEQEFKETAEKNIDGTDWSNGLFGETERSEAGGIITIEVGGVKVRGTDFRKMFGLRSTNVEIEEKDGGIVFTVRGYGHGVGMSQYGANYMAGQGRGYEEILKAYYTGIEIERK